MGVKVREKVPGSGVWWVFVSHKGKRTSHCSGSEEAAQSLANALETKIALGDFDIALLNEKKHAGKAPPSPAFEKIAKIWIEKAVPATCKASTTKDYQAILKNHVLPAFGKKPVAKIDQGDVREFLLGKIADGCAKSTVTHIKNCLGGVFKEAVYKKLIPANPAHGIGRLHRKQAMAPKVDPLTRAELATLLKTFKEHYAAHYPLALTLARTGMRRGEALGLQWGDIDFNGRFIHIQRSRSKYRTETTKNDKDRRVDMSKQLADTLEKLRTQRKKEALKRGMNEIPEWVFLNEDWTGPIDGDNWRRRVFAKALSKAKIRQIRIHDLRHTYASLLIQAGESLAYIRDQLGHHSIKVTVDVYGHLAPEGNKAAVDALDDPELDANAMELTNK